MINQGLLLKKGQEISNTYIVDKFLGSGAFAEVYKVTHKFLGIQALKIFYPGNIESTEEPKIFSEAIILSKITHPNIVRIFEANKFKHENKSLHYIAMEYIDGYSLRDFLKKKIRLSISETISIVTDIAKGLEQAHQLNPPLVHCDIKPENILLSIEGNKITVKVSDFGVAQHVNRVTQMANPAGTIAFMPPEGFWGYLVPASDMFSVGVLMYLMLTGVPPYKIPAGIDTGSIESVKNAVQQSRKEKPMPPSYWNRKIDKYLDSLVLKTLENEIKHRYKDAAEFVEALRGYKPEGIKHAKVNVEHVGKITRGSGFTGVAGMRELKQILNRDVIEPLQNKDLYEKYRLGFPNGILLYGPPGCGKTFIARKLAEEVEYNFIEIKPSDLASIYVHGSQEKIGNLFKNAIESAPAILFLDELDALVPKRDEATHHYSAEVNEFLTQLDKAGEKGVLVIGATNRIDKIDNAILRTGRMDKHFYVPPPDKEARVELFKIHSQERPIDEAIEFDKLADLTESYSCSDIEFIVNEAAREALQERRNILMNDFVKVISQFRK